MCDDNGFIFCVKCLACKHFYECDVNDTLVFCSVPDCNGDCSVYDSPFHFDCFEELDQEQCESEVLLF